MFNFRKLIPAKHAGMDNESDQGFPGRRLRTFDILTIAPYDHKAVVAFLMADKLAELTTAQIKVFLVLRDEVDPFGLTASWIGEHLEMSASTARWCLSVLKRKGYAKHSVAIGDGVEPATKVRWVCDRSHNWACAETLFWEFERI